MRRWRALLAVATVIGVTGLLAAPAMAQPALTRVHLGGVNDNFAPSTDPVFRGLGCTSHFPTATWMNFDDPAPNKAFCHTFRNLPKNIVCPGTNTLKIHMKAHSDIPTNDAMSLYFGAGPTRWSQTLPVVTGQPWNSGNEATVTLDLCNLPAGVAGSVTNAATEIDLASQLDVYVQDDTEIDYLELTLTAQSIELVYGNMDAFALPVDPTVRTTAHSTGRPAATRDFDATTVNEAFGETLGNPPNTTGLLPLFIVGGEIEIAMKAAGELSCNDTIGLDLWNPGASPLRWSHYIGDPTKCGYPAGLNLAGLGSPAIPSLWSGAGANTTLIMDLDNLPHVDGSVSSVVAMMSGPRRLDVELQDDTNVDYIKLRVLCSRNQPQFGRKSNIPTLSEWGMILLMLILLSAGLAVIRTKRSRGRAAARMS